MNIGKYFSNLRLKLSPTNLSKGKCLGCDKNATTVLKGRNVKRIEDFEHFVRVIADNSLLVPGVGVFINGWLADPNSCLSTVILRVNNEYSRDMIGDLIRYPRQDVVNAFPDILHANAKPGFYGLFDFKNISNNDEVELVLVTKQGEIGSVKLKLLDETDDVVGLSKIILGNFQLDQSNFKAALDQHIGPTLEKLWSGRSKPELKTRITQYGALNVEPRRTVIVPLYGRIDFVRYQLSSFADDGDFQETDLIYVLDDPGIYNQLIELCQSITHIFKVPFRVVYSGYNLGFAAANNLGAVYAKSDILVLLNSDIIPSKRGWLSRMQSCYVSLDKPGAMGVKLLFEDNSIQHIGMTFVRDEKLPGIWLNDHLFKGLPESLADIKPIEEVQAVTAACLMIYKCVYDELDGLDENYILGDFEDSDLCLKASNAGLINYLLGSEKLYHLERQSQSLFSDNGWKNKLTIYNGWLHTEKWGKTIKEIVK